MHGDPVESHSGVVPLPVVVVQFLEASLQNPMDLWVLQMDARGLGLAFQALQILAVAGDPLPQKVVSGLTSLSGIGGSTGTSSPKLIGSCSPEKFRAPSGAGESENRWT